MGFLDNLFSGIIDPNKTGGFSQGSAKAQKSGGGSNAPSASKGSAKATSYAKTGKSTSSTMGATKKTTTSTPKKNKGGGGGEETETTKPAAQQALEDYATQSAVDRARSIVDEKAEPTKKYGFEALNSEVQAAQDRARNAEINYAAALEKYNYDAGNPNVKSAQQVLDDALREAKIFTAAAENAKPNRGSDVVKGALKQTAGAFIDTAGTAYEGGTRGAQAQTEREIAELKERMNRAQAAYDENASAANAAYLEDVKRELAMRENIDYSKLDEVTDKIYGKADEFALEGEEHITKAKEGLGKVGQFAVDAGVAGTQLLTDIGLGLATGGMASIPMALRSFGGRALLPMALRSFGGGAGEARRNGATYEEQVGYGAATAAVELVTEKLFGGDAGVYGSGLLDKVGVKLLNTKLLSKLGSTAAGKATLRILGQMGSEGAEEFIASAVNPLIRGIYNDKTAAENYSEKELSDWLSDWLYDGLIGAVLGGAGAIVSAGVKPTANEETASQEGQPPAETPAPSVQAPQNADNAPVVESGEIIPTATQNAETAPPAELNNAVEQTGQVAETPASVQSENVPAKPATQQTPPGKTVATESAYLENLLNEEERQIEGLTEEDFTHEQRHDATVNAEADERITVDGTAKVQADLIGKDPKAWNDTDVVAAQKVLASEVEKARNLTGEDAVKAYAEIAKLAKAYRDSGTEAGRAFRQRRGFGNSVDGMIAAATEALFGDNVKTRKGVTNEQKLEIARQVADLATRYNNIAQGDVDAIVDMIKEVSGIRRTNGLFAKETSRAMNWALDIAKNFPDGEQFLSEVLATQIKSVAGDYVAPDITNSIKSYRFMSMLSKISTVARNLVSNGVLDGMEMFSNNISVPLDMLLSTFTGTRSTTFEGGVLTSSAKRKGTTEGMIRSMIQVGLDADITDAPSKYDQTAGRNFKMTGNALERLLSTWEKYENYALKTADEAAKGGIKAEKQRGIDALLEAGKIQKGALADRAENVALERTLQSDTAASKAALGLRNVGNVAHVGNLGLGDLVMPYAKVPANAVSMSAAYLPSGAIPTAGRFIGVLSAAKNGTLTADQQAQFVQSFGRTLTGAGLTFASAALALAGIIKAVDDDDKDKAAAEKAAGQSGTQINLSAFNRWVNGESTEWQAGDNLMSIAFIQPINANLMMGLALAEAYKDDEVNVRKIAGANAEALADSVLEFPAVYQISNMVDNYKYSDGEDAFAKGADAAMGFAGDIAGSFVPNAVRGIAAGTDPYIRDVYSGETQAQQAWDNIKAGIPGLRDTLPVATDSWGNPKMQMASPTLNFLNQNVLPGAINTYQPNAIMPELERLTEAGITGLYPNRNAPDKIEDFELTYEEKQKYLQTANTMQSTMYNEAKESGFYDALTDEQKGEWLKDIQQFAEGAADNEYLASKGEKGEDNWDAIAALSDPVYYLGAKNAYSDATNKNNAEPNYAALDAFMSHLPNMDGYTRNMLDEQSGFKNLRFAYDVFGMDAETTITDRNMISETQKNSLGGKTGGSADMAAIAKNGKGSDEDKLKTLEVANLPASDDGKRAAIVRRTEAAMAQGIPFDDWAKIETYITDTGSTSKATIMAAGEKYGYNGYDVYNIYKKASNDENVVAQVNDYFSRDYVAPDDVSLSEYLTGEEVTEADKASTGGGGGWGGGRSWGGRSGSSKPANLGNSVNAVRSIANSGGTTSNSSKYMRQALNDVIAQNKKQQATQPTVKWEDLLAGYVKGIK